MARRQSAYRAADVIEEGEAILEAGGSLEQALGRVAWAYGREARELLADHFRATILEARKEREKRA